MSYRRRHLKPKLRKLKPKKRFYKKPLFWVVFVCILTATGCYVFLFSVFQISTVSIMGNQKVQSNDIETIAWSATNTRLLKLGSLAVYSKSILLFDSQTLSEDLLKAFPDIEEVKIEKQFNGSVILTIKERSAFAVFCQGINGCFLLDLNGVIFERVQDEPVGMTVISSSSLDGSPISLGDSVIDKSMAGIISKIKDDLQDDFQIEVTHVSIKDSLVVTTSENWQVYFDPNSDMDLQITKMNTLLKTEISPDVRKNLHYIYLQYKDRAYYK